jgi:hypothetical protein
MFQFVYLICPNTLIQLSLLLYLLEYRFDGNKQYAQIIYENLYQIHGESPM